MYTYGHWNCNFEIDFEKTVSFVYNITVMNHQYIGFKNLYKKVYALPLPNIKTESNWKIYTSSSRLLNHMLHNGNVGYFEIIKTFESSSEAMAYERKLLSDVDAMHNSLYLNNSNGFSLSSSELLERDVAISNSIKILWKDETYRTKTIEGQNGRIPWNKGLIYSDEHKLKMSKIGKELWSDEDFYNKHVRRNILSDWFKTLSDEEIENYKNNCRERSKNIPNFNKGYVMSDEHKQKLSDAKTGTTLSEEHKEKISQSMKGIQRTEEYKNKMSEIKSKSTRRNVNYVEIDGIRYKSLRQAAISLNINQDTLKSKCESDDYSNYIVVFKSEKDLKKNRIKKPQIDYIIIDDIKYNSISEAANVTGECRNSISKKIKSSDFTNYNVIYK